MQYVIKQSSITSPSFTVVYDHREEDTNKHKKPWTWLAKHYTLERVTLRTGDYSIKGFENRITIDRKSGIRELLDDLGGIRGRFKRFLTRMSKFECKCIIVEQPLTRDRVIATVEKRYADSNGKSRLGIDTVYKWIPAIMSAYGIPILFCDKTSIRRIVPTFLEMAYMKVRESK